MECAKRRYEIDSMIIDIPLKSEDGSEIIIEDYSELIENELHTPNGHRIVLCVEDACKYASDNTTDCGSCDNYEKAGEKALFGVCKNENNRKNANKGGHSI